MMAQKFSDLHGVVIKWNTTQPRIVYNATNMRIVLELSTEYGQFKVLFILYLEFLYAENYRFNQMWPLTLLMDKIDAFTILSRKIMLSVDKWKP